ncbi:CDP-alcohol phosphatidyltransferase family protein [Catelliglobosispora koreensis]|uniref:CDP-alcohol phosphatidyltransferase family protein n=1 Tax=Catelliglobosispora koreensis TaxID=129052 RepID=UPI000362CDBE|nr:CDP-alcohol phosphatidyltransferase family protein [Catelliglobosispora koreensis]
MVASVTICANPAVFFAANRGGGLFTETVNQRAGSYLAYAASRLGLSPTALTLGNLAVAFVAAAAAVTGIPLLALVLWQLAYSLDCADGQLARVTGRTSPAGARVDVLCDVAVQISLVTAVSIAASAPPWLSAAFAGTWLVNLLTSVLASSPGAASLMPSTSLPVRLLKLVRDYGAMVLALGLVLAFAPQWTAGAMAVFTVTNGGFLLASIAQTAAAASAPER